MKANRLLNTNKIEFHKWSIHCTHGDTEYLRVTQRVNYDFDNTWCTTNFLTKEAYKQAKKWLNDKWIIFKEIIETKEQFESNKACYK